MCSKKKSLAEQYLDAIARSSDMFQELHDRTKASKDFLLGSHSKRDDAIHEAVTTMSPAEQREHFQTLAQCQIADRLTPTTSPTTADRKTIAERGHNVEDYSPGPGQE